MSQLDRGVRCRAARIDWIHLGASSVLQPLSEEFLYRSPVEPVRRHCRRRVLVRGRVDRV